MCNSIDVPSECCDMRILKNIVNHVARLFGVLFHGKKKFCFHYFTYTENALCKGLGGSQSVFLCPNASFNMKFRN